MQKLGCLGLLFLVPLTVCAMGKKSGSREDIQPVQRGSPANPNSAYNPPSWSYTPPAGHESAAKKQAKTPAKSESKKAVPDSPAPAAEAYPDYNAPQPSTGAPPLAKDSIEPPLPDEPGGNLDKKPAFK